MEYTFAKRAIFDMLDELGYDKNLVKHIEIDPDYMVITMRPGPDADRKLVEVTHKINLNIGETY